MAIHSSTIAWKIPWTEEPGGLRSMGSQRVRHDWVTSLHGLYLKKKQKNKTWTGNSLVVQWLGFRAFTAGTKIPGRWTKMLQAIRCGQKKKKKSTYYTEECKSCIDFKNKNFKFLRPLKLALLYPPCSRPPPQSLIPDQDACFCSSILRVTWVEKFEKCCFVRKTK